MSRRPRREVLDSIGCQVVQRLSYDEAQDAADEYRKGTTTMTNQEVNQLYWELPEYARTALDVLLAVGAKDHAANLMSAMAESALAAYVGPETALEWAKWRMSLRQMAGR